MSELLKIAVCEDFEEDKNKLVTIISEYLDRNDLLAEIDTYSSGEQFLSGDISVYSLVFFDIYMDKLSGMETAKQLIAENKSVQIVFCSTSRDFAAESYDVSALHYILKPVEDERIFNVLDRFFGGIKQMKTLVVKVGRTEETVFLKDIIFTEAAGKKTILHTKHGNMEVSMPLSFFCEKLWEPEFVRPIRYALVSVKEIVKVPSENITLSDNTQLPISRTMRKHIKDVFTDYQWKNAFYEKGGRK